MTHSQSYKKQKKNWFRGEDGFSHHLLLPVLVIAAVVAIGGYILTKSHAATPLTSAPFQPAEPSIAYVDQTSGTVYTMNADGSGQKAVPGFVSKNNTYVSWSNNHKSLNVSNSDYTNKTGFLANVLPTGEPYNYFTSANADYGVAESAATTNQLAYTAKTFSGGRNDLFVQNGTSGKITQLTNQFSGYGSILLNSYEISPNGKQVLFLSPFSSNLTEDALHSIATDGKSGAFAEGLMGNGCNYANNVGNTAPHDWSPDSQNFLLHCIVNGKQVIEIHAYNNYAKSTTINLPDGFNIDNISWSPDGSKIAMSGYSTGTNGLSRPYIGVVNVDGSNPKMIKHLASAYASEPALDWSPNSDELMYVTEYYKDQSGKGYTTINTIKADGSADTTILQGPVNHYYFASWR